MLTDSPPIVSIAYIGQRTGSAEHLHYRDEQKQHKHHPHDLVTTKYTIDKVHNVMINCFLPHRKGEHILTACEDTKIIDIHQRHTHYLCTDTTNCSVRLRLMKNSHYLYTLLQKRY